MCPCDNMEVFLHMQDKRLVSGCFCSIALTVRYVTSTSSITKEQSVRSKTRFIDGLIFRRIIEHPDYDKSFLFFCAVEEGEKPSDTLLTYVSEKLLDQLFFDQNANRRVKKAVLAHWVEEYESFLETGCLRVDEFRSWWHETAELLDL